MPDADRHTLLADPTRRAILDALRSSDDALDVRELAGELGLRPNSVRDQLRRLESAGMVRSTIAEPAGRGRPRHLFEVDPAAREDPYRLLATVLADELFARPDAAELAVAAGERWGRASARAARDRPARRNGAAVDTLVEMLRDGGFAPEPLADGAAELRLRACPFLDLDPDHLAVVCNVHLGFIRGALDELDAPIRATGIEPLRRPDLCVAHLAPAEG